MLQVHDISSINTKQNGFVLLLMENNQQDRVSFMLQSLPRSLGLLINLTEELTLETPSEDD